MGTLNSWDIVDANNNATPPDGWPENTMQYSEVNDTGRAVQGTLKRFFADINGSLVAGGVADAYTVSLNESGYTSYFTGMYFACEINSDNTGATTIDVNGIGAQNVVNRDGSALEAGALQSGGIYEFRYDGTNFQVIGSIAGASVTASDATFSNSNDPDLVDTNVALNIGAADPDTAQHIEIGPSDIQSKSNSTTAAVLALNELGGDVNVGAQSGTGLVSLYANAGESVRTNVNGINLFGNVATATPPTTEAVTTRINMFDSDGTDQLAFIGFDSSNTLTINNNMHGGEVTLTGQDAGGTVRNVFLGDPDAASVLYRAGVNKLETALPSVVLRGSVASSTPPVQADAVETYIQLFDTGSNRLSYFGHSGNGNLQIANEMHGSEVQIISEDAGGTARLLFIGRPAADTLFYYAGALVAATLPAASGGFQVNNTLTGGGLERVLTTSDVAATTYRGCTAYRSTSFAVAVTTPTDIPFNAEDHDTSNIHDLVTNTERLTVPAGVSKVRVTGGLRTTNACEGLVTIRKNGGTNYIGSAGSERDGAGVSNPQENFNVCGAIINVTPGDFFTLNATFYGSGETAEASNTWLSMEIVE